MNVKEIRLRSKVPEGAYSWVLNDGRERGVKSVTLDVTLDPTKLLTGRFNHTLEIVTDLEKAGILSLNLSGEVTGPFTMTPAKVLFSNYETANSYEQIVEISVNTAEPFQLLSIEPEDPEITVERISPAETAKVHTIKVKYRAETDRQRLSTRIKLNTDYKTQSGVYLDIQGFRKRQPKRLTPRPVY